MRWPTLDYHKPSTDAFGGLRLAWLWIKRVAVTVLILLVIAVSALLWFESDNTRGTAITPAALPFLARSLADLQSSGSLTWYLHRDRITHRYSYAISGTASRQAIESFGARHGLHELDFAIHDSGTVPKLQYLQDESTGLVVKFDRGDSVYLGVDATLHNVEIFYRLRDGAFTMLIFD